MLSFLEFVSTPTADTPGTLLVLHFEDKRYIVGNLSEGSSRACVQHGVRLRSVNDVLLTGRTRWANIGGMLGMVLGMADVQAAAAQAVQEQRKQKARPPKATAPLSNTAASGSGMRESKLRTKLPSLNLHGAPNLNYAIATARRFIFRTGMPLQASEYAAPTASNDLSDMSLAPTWEDDSCQVWAMPLTPSSLSSAQPLAVSHGGRKSSFDEMESSTGAGTRDRDTSPQSVVQQMFSSDWKYDRLTPQSLKDVRMPATIYMRDPLDGKLVRYSGPVPGGDSPIPDLTVLVRNAWPATQTDVIPPTVPKQESLSYIIRSHPSRGRFLPDRAKELEVERGPNWNLLASGQTVQNKQGRDILPEMVLAPSKPGAGFIIAELPSSDYIASLENRPELSDSGVMTGVFAMIWILGANVVGDPRILQLQERLSHLQHIVSSPDLSSDHLCLESAARSACRNHHLDSGAFPALVEDASHLNRSRSSGSSTVDLGSAITAQRGLRINLAPNVEVDASKGMPPVNRELINKDTETELSSVLKDYEHLVVAAQPSDSPWPAEPSFQDIQILTLGTGSSHPSTRRNVSGTLVRVPGCGSYLFDCGEGTLGTLQRMYTRPELDAVLRDLKMIWISHMHADHHLGLTTVIKAWYDVAHDSTPGSQITTENFTTLKEPMLGVVSDSAMLHWLYEYSAVEDFGHSRILPLATRPTRHATKPSERTPTLLNFGRAGSSQLTAHTERFTAKATEQLGLSSLDAVYVTHCAGAQAVTVTTSNGFRVSYSGDCRPSADFAAIGKNSHVLIHEATFEDDKRGDAVAKKHSTAGEAMVVGREMNAEAVILTHFSQRYAKMPPLGVHIAPSQRQNQPPEALRGILENRNGEDDSTAPTDDAPMDESGAANVGLDPDPSSSNRKETGSSLKSAGADPQQKPTAQPSSTYIDEDSVARLISDSGMRVVMAFDYMRLALKDLPRLAAKQPWMRAIYDRLEEEKEKAAEVVEDDAAPEEKDKQKTREKQEKKRAKAQKWKEEQGQKAKRPKSEDNSASSVVEESMSLADGKT